MKSLKKIVSVIICAALVVLCFAGCSSSSSDEAQVIDDETMLIAYTAEKKPFIYKDENGALTGFDVELIKNIFNEVKGDFKTYKFVQVDEGYKIGEDIAYTDDEGNEYTANVMVGGVLKDTGSFNKDYSFTNDLIDNRVITVTAKGSAITSYAKLDGADVGIYSDAAKTALDKNTEIKDSIKTMEYDSAEKAINAIKSGDIDALIIDEFSFNTASGKDNLVALNGELDTQHYVFAFKKWDANATTFNEAIYELKNPDYNDADEFTPIVEKYFGYNASMFEYVPESGE